MIISLLTTNISGWFILLLIFIFYGIPILSTILALYLRKKEPKKAKIIGILTTAYVIISLGTCGVF